MGSSLPCDRNRTIFYSKCPIGRKGVPPDGRVGPRHASQHAGDIRRWHVEANRFRFPPRGGKLLLTHSPRSQLTMFCEPTAGLSLFLFLKKLRQICGRWIVVI